MGSDQGFVVDNLGDVGVPIPCPAAKLQHYDEAVWLLNAEAVQAPAFPAVSHSGSMRRAPGAVSQAVGPTSCAQHKRREPRHWGSLYYGACLRGVSHGIGSTVFDKFIQIRSGNRTMKPSRWNLHRRQGFCVDHIVLADDLVEEQNIRGERIDLVVSQRQRHIERHERRVKSNTVVA